jgi:uncharacterized protein YrrD
MRKGHSLLGLAIINHSGGEHLGKVLDLVFDHGADECVALVIRERELFGFMPAQVVPWNQIITIGPDAVMVESGKSVIAAKDDARIRRIMDSDHHLIGTRIYTDDGRYLGTFGDVYMDSSSGRVLGYEVSGGFVSDTVSGKRFLPAEVGPDIGKDTVIVPSHAADLLEQQAETEPGGIKGAAKTAGEKIGENYDSAKARLSESYAGIASASVEKQQEFVVGKTAGRDVVLPAKASSTDASPAELSESSETVALEGDVAVIEPTGATVGASAVAGEATLDATFVTPAAESSVASTTVTPVTSAAAGGGKFVHQGQIITHEHALRATELGILKELVASALAGLAAQGYDTAREHTGGVAGKAGDVAGGIQERAEEAAIGKSAAREVMLSNGEVLVAPGQFITQAVMDEARRHGKEKEVIASAGLGAASESVQSGTQAVKQGAGNLWDTIKEKTAELTGVAHEKKAELDASALQKRINGAVGRPVNRVILAPDDTVILNTGDIITHKAINTAQEQGVLEMVLDSVYDAAPDITPEMQRVEGKGEAALENQAEPSDDPITATVTPGEAAQDESEQGALLTYDGRPPVR